jgi:uncharacterized delta-60 repeat protein
LGDAPFLAFNAEVQTVLRNSNRIRPRFSFPVIGLALALTACPESPKAQPPGFSLLFDGKSLQVTQGSSTELEVRLKRDRFTDPITVTASDLPAGVTAGAVTTTGSSLTLRFLAAADAVQGDAKSVSVFATAGGTTSEVVKTPLSVRGAPGSLDTTFNGGRVTTSSSSSFVNAAFTPDDRIVLVGPSPDFATTVLARLNADGKPDSTFLIRTFDLALGQDFIGAVAVQGDGKIVVAFRTGADASGLSSLGVARFTPQGALDPSFSGDGIATIQAGVAVLVKTVSIAPDGQIIVGGSIANGADREALVARFSPNGQPNLGAKGFITDSFGSSDDSANAVAAPPDGSIIVAGAARQLSQSQLVVARYRSDGSKDAAFGQDGHVRPKFGLVNDVSARVVALQPDGKITVVAFGQRTPDVFSGTVVARLLSSGNPDPSFSTNGTTFLDDLFPSSLIFEPSGRLVIAGTTLRTFEADFAVTRLEPNGTLDFSFGNDGRRTTDFGGSERGLALSRTLNGRIALVGSTDDHIALSRYWP